MTGCGSDMSVRPEPGTACMHGLFSRLESSSRKCRMDVGVPRNTAAGTGKAVRWLSHPHHGACTTYVGSPQHPLVPLPMRGADRREQECPRFTISHGQAAQRIILQRRRKKKTKKNFREPRPILPHQPPRPRTLPAGRPRPGHRGPTTLSRGPPFRTAPRIRRHSRRRRSLPTYRIVCIIL